MFENLKNIDLRALDEVMDSYDYDTDPVLRRHFRPLEKKIWRDIVSYGKGVNDYGKQMEGHLERIAKDGAKFLAHLGFSPAVQHNFWSAFRLSDLGKLHKDYDVTIWSLPHRPTEDERAEKRLHAARGPEVFAEYLQGAPEELLAHPHITTVIPALMAFHHERVDGNGPFGKTGDEMGTVIQAACIVDAYDGDRIRRPHQDHQRTPEETLNRMAGLA